jgi:hypothetical protein
MFAALNSFLTASGAGMRISDVFSTYLYTGNASSQTIINGINLSTKDGLVWIKNRTAPGSTHVLTDTIRGAGNFLQSNGTGASINNATSLSSFSSNGFSVGSYSNTNGSGDSLVSWTFRKQPKFFDVVTWTGNGVAGRQIAHSLGSVPGCIIVKCTSNAADWAVWHRSMNAGSGDGNAYMWLNLTQGANADNGALWGNGSTYIAPTSTVFTVAGTGGETNANGRTYVAYIFAHNAGGFGLTGNDNVISCGSYTGTGSSQNVDIGYQPQFVLIKRTDDTYDWIVVDTSRGLSSSSTAVKVLNPNSSSSEFDYTNRINTTSTGFNLADGTGIYNATSGNYIYIAIRASS